MATGRGGMMRIRRALGLISSRIAALWHHEDHGMERIESRINPASDEFKHNREAALARAR